MKTNFKFKVGDTVYIRKYFNSLEFFAHIKGKVKKRWRGLWSKENYVDNQNYYIVEFDNFVTQSIYNPDVRRQDKRNAEFFVEGFLISEKEIPEPKWRKAWNGAID